MTVHGNLLLSPEALLSLTSRHARFKAAPEQIDSLAKQSANAICGIAVLFVAFLTQFGSFLVSRWGVSFSHHLSGYTLVFFIAIGTLYLSFLVRDEFYYRTKHDMGKIEICNIIASYNEHPRDTTYLGTLEYFSNILLVIERRPDETSKQFLDRLCRWVGAPLSEAVYDNLRDR
jgi:hypothetical protein